jgi:CRISPR/Cas system-associated exonuclease Cas4 (RecB family)
LELAHIIAELPDVHFIKKSVEETTGELIAHGESIYTKHEPAEITGTDVEQLQELVRARYTDNNISVTLLNNFFECPWKWYFRNFLQLPDVKSASLAFGSAMHSVLENILRESKVPTKKQLETLVRDALIAEGVEEAGLDQEVNKGIVCIQNFIDQDFKNLATNRMTERSVSYRDPLFPNLSMYGKIDLTETFSDGTIAVTDFKTGGSKTSGMIEKRDDDGRMSDYLRQLAMYSYLITGNNSSAQVAQSKLYFLEAKDTDKNRVYSTRITDEYIELLKKDIADYQHIIESGNWISQTCHFKPYGTGATECEYCKRAREVYLK